MDAPDAASDERSGRSPTGAAVSRRRDSVTVMVPATTANLGCGFDCMGLALDIWNELIVERATKFEIIVEGEGKGKLPMDESNLVCQGLRVAFQAAGIEVPPLRYVLHNAIPFSRGLGSSSAAIVSGIIAGLVLCGHELPIVGEEGLLQLAAGIEGHPDNVAPAIYGGFQIGCFAGRWNTERVRIPHGLQCILFIPDFSSETSEARALLPDKYSRADCVFNIARAAMVVNAFATGDLSCLGHALDDRLHQPYRAAINPHLSPLIEAAKSAGAHGAFLSGAGPAVLALVSGAKGDVFHQQEQERRDKEVAQALLDTAAKVNVPGRVFITRPTERGAHVSAVSPPFSVGPVKHFSSWKEL